MWPSCTTSQKDGCSLLAAMRITSHLYATVAALPIPPEVLNSSGVKDLALPHGHDIHMHGTSPLHFICSMWPAQVLTSK